MDYPTDFILASQSPRRRELLRRAGYRFRVVPPLLPEPDMTGDCPPRRMSARTPDDLPGQPPPAGMTPAQLAEALALFKAVSVQSLHPESMVLGADTIVACGGRIFGKAADADEARQVLAALAGVRQEVITGMALLLPAPPGQAEVLDGPERRLVCSDVTYVTMKPMSAAQIDAYVASGEWQDKAGAYAIQETADAFIERVEGSWSNVVGLPMELLARMFEQAAGMMNARE